jgi:cytochrome c oxidase subunit III
MQAVRAVGDIGGLSPYQFEREAPLWWGFVLMITIESAVFATLVASYFYLKSGISTWPPGGLEDPELLLPTLNTLFLLASMWPMHLADRAAQRGDSSTMTAGLVVSTALAVMFLTLKVIEYADVPYLWNDHAYGSIVWTIVGFHTAHVLALVLKTTVVAVLAGRGYFNEQRRLGVTVNGIYWHFVVLIWVPLYLVLYWSPRLS